MSSLTDKRDFPPPPPPRLPLPGFCMYGTMKLTMRPTSELAKNEMDNVCSRSGSDGISTAADVTVVPHEKEFATSHRHTVR